MREVEHALHAEGRAVLLADCDDDPEVEAARVADLLDRQVDALLIIAVDERQSRDAVAKAAAHVPLVLLDRGCGPGIADLVTTDNATGMALVLDHLVSTGRRRICFVGAAGTGSAAVERLAAYEAETKALGLHGLGPVELGDFSLEWGRAAVDGSCRPGRTPSSAPTTSSRSARCNGCGNSAWTSRATSPSPASTTSPWRTSPTRP